MTIISQNKRYLPHEITTTVNSVKLYRQTNDISFVCRRYHISKASLMRWNKQYDGTKKSLPNKSHRPHSPHPNAHIEQELTWIRNYHRRNPNSSICELYGKLREEKAYNRHPGSLYRVFVRLGYRQKAESTRKKSKHLGHYDTPTELGVKWQMDVKYVPAARLVGEAAGEKYDQYTFIDEYSRFRYLEAFKEQSTYSSTQFPKHVVEKFPYAIECIQTDKGFEFTNEMGNSKNKPLTLFEKTLAKLRIRHKKIKPFTPRYNGKVKRSHRKDNEEFYACHTFYSFDDFTKQLAVRQRRYNASP